MSIQEFIVEGRTMTTEEYFQWRDQQTAAKLLDKDDCEQYRGEHGVPFKRQNGGATTINVLQFLYGLPLSNLILAYVEALHPTSLLISRGVITTICSPGRVAIFVDENDVVKSIQQEVHVGYSCGATIGTALRVARAQAGLLPDIQG